MIHVTTRATKLIKNNRITISNVGGCPRAAYANEPSSSIFYANGSVGLFAFPFISTNSKESPRISKNLGNS